MNKKIFFGILLAIFGFSGMTFAQTVDTVYVKDTIVVTVHDTVSKSVPDTILIPLGMTVETDTVKLSQTILRRHSISDLEVRLVNVISLKPERRNLKGFFSKRRATSLKHKPKDISLSSENIKALWIDEDVSSKEGVPQRILLEIEVGKGISVYVVFNSNKEGYFQLDPKQVFDFGIKYTLQLPGTSAEPDAIYLWITIQKIE
jgi:hypothetical protein